MPQLALIMLITILWAIIGLGVEAGLRMRRFVALTPAFRSQEDFERFKRLQVAAMSIAWSIIALGVILLIIGAALMYQGFGLHEPDTLFLGVPFLVLCCVTLWEKRVEARVEAVPASDASLREERDRLMKAWKRMFPDFEWRSATRKV